LADTDKEQLRLFDDLRVRGEQSPIEADPAGFRLQYNHPHGKLYQGDAIDWLRSLEAETVDLIFADPPYNIKKAEWDNFESQEAYIQWSLQWIEQAARVLKPDGSMYILNTRPCVFLNPVAGLSGTTRIRPILGVIGDNFTKR
jgi:site-specific DNA-methyltransferase (adenine-specific)